ncbi:hypothetical protein ACIBO9_27975 [Streptomyces prunicolor]|uniref:hypothetical protein n=1 Tax=Streptomyces prunicolor TaxID=67348 RepID=UPI0037D43B42
MAAVTHASLIGLLLAIATSLAEDPENPVIADHRVHICRLSPFWISPEKCSSMLSESERIGGALKHDLLSLHTNTS